MNSRKKLTILMMACLLLLFGCGKSEKGNTKSDAAQALDEKIQSIGTVSLESGSLIADIENDYMKLTDKEKTQLEYYQSYVTAKEAYEKLVKEQKEQEEKQEAMITEIENLLKDKKTTEARDKINSIQDADIKADMQKKLKEKCYCDIDLMKFNDVVSIKSDKSKEDDDEGDRRFSYYYYNIWSDIKSAFNDYNLYLNANCDKTDSQNELATSYHYNLDGKEITIMLYDVAVNGVYLLQITYDK